MTILVVRRASHKKKLAKVRESVSMETGYRGHDQNAQGIEMGTTYKPGTGRRYMPLAGESPHV